MSLEGLINMTVLKSRSTKHGYVSHNCVMEQAQENGGIAVITGTFRDGTAANGEYGDTKNERCGWGPFSPSFCQKFRDPKWVLFWLCWAGGIQGMVVNGFVNVVISNIEKRYDLTSTETGTVASCYDIASVLCLIPVSYFGGLGCKPRYLGIGVFIIGIGSIVFSLPQFTSGKYKVGDTDARTYCDKYANLTSACDGENSPVSLSNYKYFFFFGQLLHGAGASPLYTLGVTYLDENLPLRSSSVYVGIFYALAIVGPAIGYLAGGAFLDIYVDVDKVALDGVGVTPDNPRWVGAWWIGFLISGALAFIIAFPIAGFPKQLPGSEAYKAERGAEAYKKKPKSRSKVDENLEVEESKLKFKDILKSVTVLLTNPTFMFLNLAAACEGNLLSGFATFTPKFIEAQFALPASTAAQYVGYAAIPAGGGGTFLGGYLVKRFDLHVRGIIRLCLGLTIAVLALAFIFLVHCQNVPFAGVNVKYGESDEESTQNFSPSGANFTATCNNDCHCTQDNYNPVCGVDGILYYSPCYAGCLQEDVDDDETKIYNNCSCVTLKTTNVENYEAIQGKCASTCGFLPIFMPFFAILMLLTFVASMPALSATLRCVPNKERSFALGIQWIIARCLGSIPGPILFGKLIDITCELWQTKCNEQGSCFFYDNKQMSYNLLAVSVVGKTCSIIFFFLALMLYKGPSADENDNTDSIDSSPAPPPKNLSLATNVKSNQSVHTIVTNVSESYSPPVTPKHDSTWTHL